MLKTFVLAVSFSMSPQAKEANMKINKWDYIKLKKICTKKEASNKNQKTTYQKKKILAKHVPERGLKPKIYNEPNLTTEKQPDLKMRRGSK